MSFHEDPAQILQHLWYKQYTDEKTYVALRHLAFIEQEMAGPFMGDGKVPMMVLCDEMLERLSEGRRLLEAMGLHVKIHNVETGYHSRKITGLRYFKSEKWGRAISETLLVENFPLKIFDHFDFCRDEKDRASSADTVVVISLDSRHEDSLQLSCTEGDHCPIYYNGHSINLAAESPKQLQVNDHIIVGQTSIVIDWIERFLHHRATGRVIIHGLFCSYL